MDTEKILVSNLWEILILQNNWHYLPDTDNVVSNTMTYLYNNDIPFDHHQIRRYLISQYAENLYYGVKNQNNDAASDLYVFCIRNALNYIKQSSISYLEDISMDVLLIIINKIDSITPKFLLSYTLMCLRNSVYKYLNNEKFTYINDDNSYVNSAFDINQNLFEEDIKDELRSILSPLQFSIIQRYIFLDQSPREIATILGISAVNVRIEKSRALRKIRENPSFIKNYFKTRQS